MDTRCSVRLPWDHQGCHVLTIATLSTPQSRWAHHTGANHDHYGPTTATMGIPWSPDHHNLPGLINYKRHTGFSMATLWIIKVLHVHTTATLGTPWPLWPLYDDHRHTRVIINSPQPPWANHDINPGLTPTTKPQSLLVHHNQFN